MLSKAQGFSNRSSEHMGGIINITVTCDTTITPETIWTDMLMDLDRDAGICFRAGSPTSIIIKGTYYRVHPDCVLDVIQELLKMQVSRLKLIEVAHEETRQSKIEYQRDVEHSEQY